MAQFKVYPKGSVDAIEWTLTPDADPAKLWALLSEAGNREYISVPTTAGTVLIDTFAYGALQIIE